ncbi:MAG TPA: mechanosensitive ion channel domain-containing protein [Candidatus Limnocylindrales bacterium]|nr:mechanosensitive ion channel domain-containing protein [Candidatus Limnocylindrales bacterium]
MKSSRPWLGRAAAACAFLLAAGALQAHAQSNGQQTIRIATGLTLDVESIQERIKKVQASERLDADTKAQAVRDYEEAIEQLELAAQWQRRLDALHTFQREQPRLNAAARRELQAGVVGEAAAIPPDASLEALDTRLSEASAALESLRSSAARIDEELRQLAERRLRLPGELATLRLSREHFLGGLELPSMPTSAAETSLAHQAARLAEDRLAMRRQEALELELASLETRRELLESARELMRGKIEAKRAVVDSLSAAVADRRSAEAQKAAEEASAVQASLERVHPVLGKLAQESTRLASRRSGPEGLVHAIEAAGAELASTGQLLISIQERAQGVRQKAQAADFSNAVGLLLRKERAELPDIAEARGRIRARQPVMSDAQLQLLTLEDLRAGLPQLEAEVRQILDEQGPALAGERTTIERAAADVLRTRREYLDALIRDSNTYFATLVDLDARERQLVDAVESYTRFLDENVLWIRDTTLPRLSGLREVGAAAAWAADPGNAAALVARVRDKARTDPLFVSLALLGWAAAALLRWRARRRHRQIYQSRGAGFGGPLAATVQMLALNAYLAALWPALMLIAAWMIESAPSLADDYSRAVAETLQRTAPMLFGLEFLRRAAAARGPGRAFLAFPETALAVARRQIMVLEALLLPAFAIAFFFDNQPEKSWADSIGRIAFLTGVVTIATCANRALHPGGALGATLQRRAELPWVKRFLARAYRIPLLIGATIGGLSLAGYDFTAREIAQRLWWTGWWVFLFVLTNAVLVRWLARARQSVAERKVEEGRTITVARDEGEVEVVEDTTDLSVIGVQTRQLLRLLVGAGLAISIFVVWSDVVPALRGLERIELWSVTALVEQPGSGAEAGKPVETRVPVTAANLVVAIVALVFVVVGSRNLPALLEMMILQRATVDQGLRYAIATLARYVIAVVGSIVLFRNLGVAWSHVQWLVAAVSVGLGFGLQEIFGNFVSGLILLLERPIRVGDTVTLGGVSGTVSRMSMRATTIVDFDRKELIVPNKEFITGQLVNWSLSDTVLRLVVPLAVAYGTDTALVERLLLEAARQCADVLEEPRATAVCVRFGDAGIDFELRVFVEGTDAVARVRHALHVEIERKLRLAGIEIASPQRDVRIRSVDSPLPVALQPKPVAT